MHRAIIERVAMNIASLLIVPLLLIAGSPAAAMDDGELLPPDEAFAFTAHAAAPGVITARWTIADGYYLYRDRIQFRTARPQTVLGEVQLPDGRLKNDEFFGEVEIYRGQLTATVALVTAAADGNIELIARSQGCADIGVCYPPHEQRIQLRAIMPTAAAAAPTQYPSTDTPLNGGPVQSLTALAQSLETITGDDPFLDPNDAFIPSAEVAADGAIDVRWHIAEGYYLYRDKLTFKLLNAADVALGEAELADGQMKQDAFFGDTEVYYREVNARLPVSRSTHRAQTIRLELGFQGCADQGLCYPPQTQVFELSLPALGDVPNGNAQPALTAAAVNQSNPPPLNANANANANDEINTVLSEGSLPAIALFFFIAGLGLAFTACLYPMIPILSSLIVGQGSDTPSPVKGLTLSLAYVLGVAATYSAIGALLGLAGDNVQGAFQHPFMLVAFALVFVALALSMFGFYTVQLPAGVQAYLTTLSNRQRGGNLVGVFAMGVLSALIVGPCAGPVIVGAGTWIAQRQDAVLGAAAFFAMGLGIGAPLLLVGAFGAGLLPRAGRWMDYVKAVFGVVMLGVAIFMLERVLPGPVALLLWALLFIISGVYLGAFEPVGERSPWFRLWKGLGLSLVLFGAVTLLGAASGGRDVTNPLHRLMQRLELREGGSAVMHTAFKRIKSVEDLQRELSAAQAAGKPVMLDYYADWCTYCLTLEDYVFPDPKVVAAYADTVLLQADVTAQDSIDKALQRYTRVLAPPTLIFWDRRGNELAERLIGAPSVDDLAAALHRATAR